LAAAPVGWEILAGSWRAFFRAFAAAGGGAIVKIACLAPLVALR